MKGRSAFSGLMVIALVALLSASALAQGGGQGGPGGRGGRGLMGAMTYLERAWTNLAFELGATTEQYMKLFPAFKEAWDLRKAALEKARQTNDFQSLGPVLDQVQQMVDKALGETLTPEQATKWNELKGQQMMGGRGGRGGPGGGGGGNEAGGPPQ